MKLVDTNNDIFYGLNQCQQWFPCFLLLKYLDIVHVIPNIYLFVTLD
jgi:hypothetical protein